MTQTPKDHSLLISGMDKSDRPREKAMRDGIKSLSDAELMALIFGTGIKGKGVVALCNEILETYDRRLSRVTEMDAHDFMKRHKGIGPAKALTFMAALELGVRAAADAVADTDPPMSSSINAFRYMNRRMCNLDHEEFWILFLKNNLKPLLEFKAGQGSMNCTAVDVRLIIREAILAKSTAMILFHNHPSGALKPSEQDKTLTRRIVDAAKYFEIRVLDHIVIGHGSYYSFNDEGIMPS